MEWSTTEQVLLIFLSSALGIFLVLGIAVLVKVLQLLSALQRIAERAEHLAETANSIGDVFRKTAAPVAIGRLFANLAETVFKTKGKRKGDRGDD